jgi:RNA polymerase sigma-70 factor, ECF subfamily
VSDADVILFEENQASLLALAYRMLGDFGRAEDIVQDAWIRWQGRDAEVESPKAYLITVVTRLCLNELDSAHVRKEEMRGDRLPEPVSLDDTRLARVEALDQISMAFLVLLQRLTPAERAALLLHDVFDFDHAEIAALIQKSEAACRQLLKRARTHVSAERRALTVSKEAHRRLLQAFLSAASEGDVAALSSILADDVVLIADAGPQGGRYGPVKNLPGPLVGLTKVAAFVASVTPRGAANLTTRECELNGQPAIVVCAEGRPITAILIAVADEKIRSIFMHADVSRLRRFNLS